MVVRVALYDNLPPGGARRVLEAQAASGSQFGVRYERFRPATWDWLHRLGALGPAARLFHLDIQERKIARRINRAGFDLAVVHGCQITQAPLILARLKLPTVYFACEVRRRTYEAGYRPETEHRQGPALLLAKSARRIYEMVVGRRDRRAFLAADRVLCISHQTAREIDRCYGVDAEICPPGIDLTTFCPGTEPRCNYVLSVGSLDPSKGHDVVVKALSLLPSERRPALVIPHERHDLHFVQQLNDVADELGVDLQLRSAVTDPELVALYRQALATVCAAPNEPLGLVPLESAACGTPVIAIESGGYMETTPDMDQARLVSPEPVALAEAIDAVIEQWRNDPGSMRNSVTERWGLSASAARLHGALKNAE